MAGPLQLPHFSDIKPPTKWQRKSQELESSLPLCFDYLILPADYACSYLSASGSSTYAK